MKRFVIMIALLFVGIGCFAQASCKQLTITNKDGKVYVGYLLEETNSYYRISEGAQVHVIYKEDIDTLSIEDIVEKQKKTKEKKVRKPIESEYFPKGLYGTASISSCWDLATLPLSVGAAYRFSPVLSVGLNSLYDPITKTFEAGLDRYGYGPGWGGLLEIRTDLKGLVSLRL